jgi:glutaredoxin 3
MTIELFYRETCPYSSKVREFIREAGLISKIEEHDVEEDSDSLDELIELNEDDQVPCLVVDGEPILESDAIVDWLAEYGKGL